MTVKFDSTCLGIDNKEIPVTNFLLDYGTQ